MTEYEIETYLKTFFIHLQEWIDDGCPASHYFSSPDGVCGNLWVYMDSYPESILSVKHSNIVDEYWFQNLLNKQITPFNDEDYTYSMDINNLTMYSNQKRLAFIKEWATKEIL